MDVTVRLPDSVKLCFKNTHVYLHHQTLTQHILHKYNENLMSKTWHLHEIALISIDLIEMIVDTFLFRVWMHVNNFAPHAIIS